MTKACACLQAAEVHTAFVKHLKENVDEGMLREIFKDCGDIKSLKIGREAETNRSRVRLLSCQHAIGAFGCSHFVNAFALLSNSVFLENLQMVSISQTCPAQVLVAELNPLGDAWTLRKLSVSVCLLS